MSSSNPTAAAGPTTTTLPPPARARLTRELSRLANDPPPGIAAYAPLGPADPSTLRAQITGPPSTPYAGGIFLVTVRFTSRYPFEPPRVRFVTPVYHPNVDSAGRICLDTLKQPPAGSWSPAVSLPSLLTTLRTLLSDPNPDDALVPEIADLYKQHPGEFEEEARRWTVREATGDKCSEMERKLDGGDGEDKDATAAPAGAAAGAAGAKKVDKKIEKENEENKKKEDEEPKEEKGGNINPADEQVGGEKDDDRKKAVFSTTTSSSSSSAATGKRVESPSSSDGKVEDAKEGEEGANKRQKIGGATLEQ